MRLDFLSAFRLLKLLCRWRWYRSTSELYLNNQELVVHEFSEAQSKETDLTRGRQESQVGSTIFIVPQRRLRVFFSMQTANVIVESKYKEDILIAFCLICMWDFFLPKPVLELCINIYLFTSTYICLHQYTFFSAFSCGPLWEIYQVNSSYNFK